MKNNVTKITEKGMCVGCGSCGVCKHITFVNNELGFPAPVVDDTCESCGKCLIECIYNMDSD
ncbi:MAG: hypothetical protein K2K63_11690 [Acetatifactor sp.]|nr:hypothetical protein [Acetatifactor sp.]